MEAYAPIVADDGYGNYSGGCAHKQITDKSWHPGMRVPFATADQKLKDDVSEAEHTVRNMVGAIESAWYAIEDLDKRISQG